MRVLLVASKTGYQVREFYDAADRLGIELILATDRCHVLDNPWGDQATAVRFEQPEEGLEALAARGPFDGVVAVGDTPACIAADAAQRLGLRFHPPDATRAASDKFRTRERFRAAGMNVPIYCLDTIAPLRYPCVLKPLHFSGSRGVIRANGPCEFAAAFERIQRMTGGEPLLMEDFIPGGEFALEGIVSGGRLQTLAIFDKPDPLDGPFFEETIYVAPSRETPTVQDSMQAAAQSAVTALGFTDGPVHAEMRVNTEGVWVLEAAARPIGGLCARVLRFEGDVTLEELLLQHAVGKNVSAAKLAHGAHGVMMIPIPSAGIYSGVEGVEQAHEIPHIEAVEITAKDGQYLEPLPEGASYLGFLFSHARSPQQVESALRKAHGCLKFHISQALPVVR